MKTVITWVHHNRQFLMMDVTIEGNSTFVRFFKALLLIFKKYVCQLFLNHRIQFRRCDTHFSFLANNAPKDLPSWVDSFQFLSVCL